MLTLLGWAEYAGACGTGGAKPPPICEENEAEPGCMEPEDCGAKWATGAGWGAGWYAALCCCPKPPL